jgi:hypothetical protein
VQACDAPCGERAKLHEVTELFDEPQTTPAGTLGSRAFATDQRLIEPAAVANLAHERGQLGVERAGPDPRRDVGVARPAGLVFGEEGVRALCLLEYFRLEGGGVVGTEQSEVWGLGECEIQQRLVVVALDQLGLTAAPPRSARPRPGFPGHRAGRRSPARPE